MSAVKVFSACLLPLDDRVVGHYGPHEGNLNDPMRVFQLANCVVA
jgi:hypothetical protein